MIWIILAAFSVAVMLIAGAALAAHMNHKDGMWGDDQ